MAEGATQLNEFGSPDGDLYIKAGGIRYLKVSSTGVLSAVNGGRLDANILMFPNGPIHGWVDTPFDAGHYAGGGPMTVTVEPTDVKTNRYARIGGVFEWLLVLVGVSTGGTANAMMRVSMPNNEPILTDTGGTYAVTLSGTKNVGHWLAAAGNTFIQFFPPSGTWPLGSNHIDIRGQFILPVSMPVGAGASSATWGPEPTR